MLDTNTHTHTHGPKRRSPTDNRTQGRCFGQCFHSQISSQDFAELVSSHFQGSLIQLQAKRLTQTHTSVYCCEDTSSYIPCGYLASSKSKYTMRILTNQNPIQENEAEMQEAKKKIQVMTSQNEGAATVKAPLF